MRVHYALVRSGCAGCIYQRGDVVVIGFLNLQRVRLAGHQFIVECCALDIILFGNDNVFQIGGLLLCCQHPGGELRAGDGGFGSAVLEDISGLVRSQQGIHRHGDSADLIDGRERPDHHGAVRHLDRHAVPSCYTQRFKRIAEPVGVPLHFHIGIPLPLIVAALVFPVFVDVVLAQAPKIHNTHLLNNNPCTYADLWLLPL